MWNDTPWQPASSKNGYMVMSNGKTLKKILSASTSTYHTQKLCMHMTALFWKICFEIQAENCQRNSVLVSADVAQTFPIFALVSFALFAFCTLWITFSSKVTVHFWLIKICNYCTSYQHTNLYALHINFNTVQKPVKPAERGRGLLHLNLHKSCTSKIAFLCMTYYWVLSGIDQCQTMGLHFFFSSQWYLLANTGCKVCWSW